LFYKLQQQQQGARSKEILDAAVSSCRQGVEFQAYQHTVATVSLLPSATLLDVDRRPAEDVTRLSHFEVARGHFDITN
jgi:hypothetical protein